MGLVAGTTVSAGADSAENGVELKPAVGGKPITFGHRLCVAPMVGASDLATEMFYSDKIVSDAGYMEQVLESSPEDRPLVVQVCGNDPTMMAAAAAKIERFCQDDLFGLDAIEINLGCGEGGALA
ncbi:hypothetical protein T484DRAFT_1761046 [Baffinella frigidus]|nr:hypothetical protein T484DRAFT_1761046 [Cryptophyta sp. CCMP2293]